MHTAQRYLGNERNPYCQSKLVVASPQGTGSWLAFKKHTDTKTRLHLSSADGFFVYGRIYVAKVVLFTAVVWVLLNTNIVWEV
jgi:hypothetical protein